MPAPRFTLDKSTIYKEWASETLTLRTMITRPGLDLLSRRNFLAHTGTGLGGIALASLLAQDGLLAADASDKSPIRPAIDAAKPYAARPPHFAAKAKNVLVVFVSGALSHVDTFEYKPSLFKYDGQPMPGSDKLVTFQGEQGNLARPIRDFKPRGECGKMTSDLLPELGSLADDLCFVHSLTSKTNTHGPGENFASTGFTLDGFPSMGAWTSYALGSENDELPAFVAIPDPRGMPQAAGNNWGSGFLPAAFQGTAFSASEPIRYLSAPEVDQRQGRRRDARFPQADERPPPRKIPGRFAARRAHRQLRARRADAAEHSRRHRQWPTSPSTSSRPTAPTARTR